MTLPLTALRARCTAVQPRTPLTAMTALTAVVAAAALLWLGGCASPGTLPPPAAALAPAAAGLAADAQTAFPDAQWWRALGDPQLDALVERALAGQPSLQAAAARVTRAQALAGGVQAAQGTQLGLGVDVNRQRFTAHGLYPPPLAGNTYDSGNVQLSASVELDFFGKHDAALRAAVGQARAAQAELQAARVLLAANVARGHVALARLFAQRDLAQRTLAQRQAMFALTRERVASGLDTQLELKQSEGGLPEARQQIEALDEQIALARHQLATLTGQAPDALDTLTPALAPLRAAAPPATLGADLLGRRADIVAARWRVEASAADVAAARTAFYPDINLVGFIGLNAIGLDRLVDFGSRNIAAGPALRLPIFDGGRLRAQLQGRAAEADAAVAAYNGAVLDAAREVMDASSSWRAIERQQAEQAQALAAAEAAYEVAQQRYRAGLGSYLQVLSAESGVLAQRRQAADLRARALDTQVALMRALGGGWQPAAELNLAAAR
jgi:NodT family efflux transporter outer membrane factor (OMF) lipoprotein